MKRVHLREYLPKSLFGRALLILVFPIVLIQFTVGGIFADRIFNEMTGIMSSNYVRVINQITAEFAAAEDKDLVIERAEELGLTIVKSDRLPNRPIVERAFFDITGLYIEQELTDTVIGLRAMELESNSPLRVFLWVERDGLTMQLTFIRRFVSARNPHQLPIIMVLTSLLLTGIAVIFLRNQITPIRKLATAAEEFGKGRNVPLRPRGATEVRQATTAFLGMRQRIERHIEQRTLMLSGVSHDLRTPLTRLKLGVSMLATNEDTKDLHKDISDMEHIIDEFLSFAGEDQDEGWEELEPMAFVSNVLDHCRRSLPEGHKLTFLTAGEISNTVFWRPVSIQRCIENVVNNAEKYGDEIVVTLSGNARQVRIEIADNGPGIPKEARNDALNAFVRLDKSRNQNKGGSAGLGLAIVQDIVRGHGGTITLSDSEALGGLSVTLLFPIAKLR